MATIKTYGTILHTAEYKENDKMLSILSPSLGIISALARGCRRPKSPLLLVSDVFVTGEFVLYQQNDRYIVQSASIDRDYFDIRLDIQKLACGSYMLQLCHAFIQENEASTEVFTCLHNGLVELQTNEASHALAVLNHFIFQFAIHMGIKPRIVHCIRCENRIGKENHSILGFDYSEGGIVCADCMQDNIESIPSDAYLELYKIAQFAPYSTLDNIKTHLRVFGILNKFIELQISYSLKAAKMINIYFLP